MFNKNLPKEITSYDLLKTFAVLLMIVDHTGYYFFPEDNWFRVAGRLCVPVWFFLIGYAKSRDLGAPLWIGIAVLTLSNIVCGHYIFPVTILSTMLIIRFVLNDYFRWVMQSDAILRVCCAFMFLLIIPTNMVFEYGTLGLIIAMFGYMIRHGAAEIGRTDIFIRNFGYFALGSFVISQFMIFGMNEPQFYALLAGSSAVFYMLYKFRPAVLTDFSAKAPRPVIAFLHITGRWTLWIYVIHIVVFQLISLKLSPDRFALFDWKWMPEIF